MLPAFLASALQQLGALVFPRVCLACERLLPHPEHGMICRLCWSRVQPLPHPRCERCGHPGRGSDCRWCRFLHPCVHAARSWCWAGDPIAERALHSLKYHDWPGIAREMADRMTRLAFPRDVNLSSAVLVPVPLSPRRQRERGYNQSFLLATAVAQHLGACVLDHVLIRTRETPTQTRLTPAQRLTNVADAFRVDPVQLARRGAAAVVLVDDVITTGATLNACAHALREAGVGQVCYLTFGRARDPRDARPLRGNTSHGTQDWH